MSGLTTEELILELRLHGINGVPVYAIDAAGNTAIVTGVHVEYDPAKVWLVLESRPLGSPRWPVEGREP